MTLDQAQQLFLDSASTQWLSPVEITPALIAKADAYLSDVSDVDNDALSDIRIDYSLTVKSSTGAIKKKYRMPIAVYILTRNGDISDEMRDFLLERISAFPSEDTYRKLVLRYAIGARQHLNHKNMAHFLMAESKLLKLPNKLIILERLLQFDCVRNSSFIQFEEREAWTGPNSGVTCSQEYESHQCLMDSAVYSGNSENVQFAIKNGLKPRYEAGPYGGQTMAYVCQYVSEEPYKRMAYLFIEQATALGKLKELLSGSYHSDEGRTYCVEGFAKAGLIDLVALCASTGARQATVDSEIDNYLKMAVFRNLRGDGKGWKSSMFDFAMNSLGINPPAPDDQRHIPFFLALRSAVLAEVAEDATFLLEEANLTESFRSRAMAAVAEHV